MSSCLENYRSSEKEEDDMRKSYEKIIIMKKCYLEAVEKAKIVKNHFEQILEEQTTSRCTTSKVFTHRKAYQKALNEVKECKELFHKSLEKCGCKKDTKNGKGAKNDLVTKNHEEIKDDQNESNCEHGIDENNQKTMNRLEEINNCVGDDEEKGNYEEERSSISEYLDCEISKYDLPTTDECVSTDSKTETRGSVKIEECLLSELSQGVSETIIRKNKGEECSNSRTAQIQIDQLEKNVNKLVETFPSMKWDKLREMMCLYILNQEANEKNSNTSSCYDEAGYEGELSDFEFDQFEDDGDISPNPSRFSLVYNDNMTETSVQQTSDGTVTTVMSRTRMVEINAGTQEPEPVITKPKRKKKKRRKKRCTKKLCFPFCEVTCVPKKKKEWSNKYRNDLISILERSLRQGPTTCVRRTLAKTYTCAKNEPRRRGLYEATEPIAVPMKIPRVKRPQKRCLYTSDYGIDGARRAECFAPSCNERDDFTKVVGMDQLEILFPLLARLELSDRRRIIRPVELFKAVKDCKFELNFTVDSAVRIVNEWNDKFRKVTISECLFAIKHTKEYLDIVKDKNRLNAKLKFWARNPLSYLKYNDDCKLQFKKPSLHSRPAEPREPKDRIYQVEEVELTRTVSETTQRNPYRQRQVTYLDEESLSEEWI